MAIVSDSDVLFQSTFWKHINKALRTELHFSTVFYSQTDGFAENAKNTA
jgi:hypothetical protein